MDIIQASCLGVNAKEKICRIFVDAFFNEFGHISRDRIQLYRSFEHIFLVDKIFVAILDNEAVGFIACTDGFTNSMEINDNIFRKEYGFIKGSFIAMMLKKNFQKQPLKRGNKEGFIEIAATAPDCQKKGIATAMFKFVFDMPEFESYILEVASNNTSGISLYKKLGFIELKRKKHLFVSTPE